MRCGYIDVYIGCAIEVYFVKVLFSFSTFLVFFFDTLLYTIAHILPLFMGS